MQDKITKLLNNRKIKEIIGTNYSVNKEEIINFYNYYSYKDIDTRIGIWVGNFIKYGLDNWVDRIEQIRKTKRGSLENYILRYGNNQGTKIYNDLKEKKHPHLISLDIFDQFLNRYNVKKILGEEYQLSQKDKEEIEPILKSINFGSVMGNDLTRLANFIKYKVPNKKQRWEKLKEKKITKRHTLDNYQLLYGDLEGYNQYKKFISNMNTTTEYWINKGYTLEESKDLLYKNSKTNVEKNKSKMGMSLNKCIAKRGEEEGTEFYNKWLKNNYSKKFRKGSKESLKLFSPIKSMLNSIGIECIIGDDFNLEFILVNKNNNKSYFYDFCIPKEKIIIEYNGIHVHPNPQILTEESWKKWTIPWNKSITADIQYKKDQEKINFAKENGYTVLIIWSNEEYSMQLSKCMEYLKSHISILNNYII